MEYIKEYTRLNPREKRQLSFKRIFKRGYPEWDDSLVLMTKLFSKAVNGGRLRVLDFGCGNGNFVIDELREKIGYALGLDIDRRATVKNRCLDEVVIGDLTNPSFLDGEFDAAVSLWVLEHIDNPEVIFRQIHRVLKPKGVFAFVTPNKRSLLIFVRRIFNRVSKEWGDKIVAQVYGRAIEDVFPAWYKANEASIIKKLAKKTGFRVEAIRENFDPSYTSFNALTYGLSRIFYKSNLSIFKPHILAVLRKI